MARAMRRKTSAESAHGYWSDPLGRAGIRSAQILLVLTIVTLSIYALTKVTVVVIPILLALILASALRPLMIRLQRLGLSSMVSTWITFVGIIVILGGIITGIVFAVESQWKQLVNSVTHGLDQLQNFIVTGPFPIDQEQISAARDAVVDFITSAKFGAGAVSGLTAAGTFITGAVLMIVILFFFLKDGHEIWNFFLTPLRGRRLAKARRAGEKALEVFGGYVRGTATIALVDSVAIGLALVILQVPLAVPLAVLIFIGSFIPIVGATVTGILAALVALVTNGPLIALIVIAVVVLVQQVEGNLLQPLVMGNALKLHALVILLALTVGTVLAGIAGALLSVPLTAVAWAVVRVWSSNDGPAEPAPDTGSAAITAGSSRPAETKAGSRAQMRAENTAEPRVEDSREPDTGSTPER